MKPITIFTLILSTLGICLSSIAEQPVRQAQDRPNIILLMGDDHGWEETGYNGHPYVKTPVLDEMRRGDCTWRTSTRVIQLARLRGRAF